MRKKVLLAEQSDSTRSVTETILRQNGFEVISVSDYDRAVDVLGLSKPDIMIVGSDLTGAGDKPLYSHIRENEIYCSIPILMLASADDTNLPYPEEVIIRRPFDTNELLEKVKIFAGQIATQTESTNTSADPLGSMDLDDEFLDAALGLDNINVTDSEVLNKTGTVSKVKVSLDNVTDIGDLEEMDDSSKVESIMIHEDQTDIRRPATKKINTAQPSASGKLDIMQDQYGLSKENQKELEPEDSVHDYHWFVNEMQNESKPKTSTDLGTKNDNNDLDAVNLGETIIPVTSQHVSESVSRKPKPQDEGVEKFIDDFKKEMEKIHSDNKTETVTIQDEKSQSGKPIQQSGTKTNEQELSEAVTLFTRQFIDELAGKLANIIAGKIDSGRLMELIKNEMLAELKKK